MVPFSHEDKVWVTLRMSLLRIKTTTLEVKGKWSNHLATEAPYVVYVATFCYKTLI